MMNESILLLYRTKLVRHLEKWEFLCYNNIAEIEQHIVLLYRRETGHFLPTMKPRLLSHQISLQIMRLIKHFLK